MPYAAFDLAFPPVMTAPTERPDSFAKRVASFASRRTALSSVSGFGLAALARETKRKIQWDHILRGAGSQGVQWKWLENTRIFSIYTKTGSKSQSVLAIGTLKASVPEVASLLASRSQDEYAHKMASLHSDFKHGAYVADVPNDSASCVLGDDDDVLATAQLSVRSATFAHPRWLHRDDEWHFLEATQLDTEAQRFEKHLTTLASTDVADCVAPTERNAKRTNGKRFRGIAAAYCVEPDDTASPTEAAVGPPTARVYFYGDVETPNAFYGFKRLLKHEASVDAMKDRLLSIASDCDYLAHLVVRRRLGVQVLVDPRRVLLPKRVMCHHCERMPLVPKSCRVCGQGVCGDCSNKYERESYRVGSGRRGTMRSGRYVRLETIRVCAPCIQRVETADYSDMKDAALDHTVVFHDSPRAHGAASDLKQLLRDALAGAPSLQRKGAVMNVIRSLVNRPPPAAPAVSSNARFGAASFQPLTAEIACLDALDDFEIETTRYDQVQLADTHGRAFAVHPKKDVTAPLPFPVTDTEDARVAEIERLGLLDDGGCDELQIICDIASKELDAFATCVTLITADEQFMVATNQAALENLRLKREESFCQHTIMSSKPLIVPHPEADVRFSRIAPVTGMGIRYYCGFPITSGEDNTVIGALCCVDQKKHDLTESQFNAMERLAETAGRVVEIQGERRRTRTLSAIAEKSARVECRGGGWQAPNGSRHEKILS